MIRKEFPTFALSLLYISSFWGELARALPAPFNQWYRIPYRLFYPLLQNLHFFSVSEVETVAIFLTIEAFLFGMLIPILVLRFLNRSPHDAGLRWTNTVSWRWGIICLLLTLPIGLWLSYSTPHPWETPLYELCEFAAMIPEHFLVFGVALALMLPTSRLMLPKELNPTDNRERLTNVTVGNSALIGQHEFFAIFAAATLFLIIHIGGMTCQEMFVSFPIGLLFAYVTLRTGSIWPALIAHWGLNLIPMTFMVLRQLFIS